ncbi:hypothetical protein CLV32_4071 [Pedobacter duraquae]|uniref:LytTr DNA-binding domain-containing protein n=2 Tax=Pedobacter duraquae TaxID=425511 RepID=A0A4R6IF18_9SPHI|nr:hypothetical protein CLV32_4071 [Pedobacter duraquae]
MFLNSVMVLIVAEYLYHVILHARKKYSFSFEQNKYLRYRILVSVIIPQLLAFILAALFFLLAKQNIFTETVWFTNYFMVDLAFILLGNGLIELFIWRQFKAYEKAEDALEDTEIPAVPSPVSTIAAQQEQPVKKYNKQKNIKVDPKLAIIYREEDALISLTTQDTLGNWPIGLSINASFTMLPATYFKINQSCIINIDGIADAWYVRETQRLHVQPVFGLPERKVSYAKNRNFKDWLATFGREMRIISKDQA